MYTTGLQLVLHYYEPSVPWDLQGSDAEMDFRQSMTMGVLYGIFPSVLLGEGIKVGRRSSQSAWLATLLLCLCAVAMRRYLKRQFWTSVCLPACVSVIQGMNVAWPWMQQVVRHCVTFAWVLFLQCAGAGISWLVQRWKNKPLRIFQHAAEEAAAGRLHTESAAVLKTLYK